jgi:hypothetical protein
MVDHLAAPAATGAAWSSRSCARWAGRENGVGDVEDGAARAAR